MDSGRSRAELVPDDAIAATVRAQRTLVETLFAEIGRVGRDDPGVTRDSYGAGENAAHQVFAEHAAALDLDVTQDEAVNSYATWPGADRRAPRIIVGSHLDSVPHGGNFDGAAGVVAGLAATTALRELGLRPACDIVTMGVRAEESVWFQVSYIGSRSALGMLPARALDALRVDTRRSLADHMASSGANPDAVRAGARAIDPVTVRAFVELHIEQAPSLIEADMPVGICTAIPGNFRYPAARIRGTYDHVGLPRRFRRDAVMAGAEFALALDAMWTHHDKAGRPMACTLGRFGTDPEKHGLTSVPGELCFSLDVRAYDEAHLEAIDEHLRDIVAQVEASRNVTFELGPRASAPVGRMDEGIQAGLAHASRMLGIPALPMGSPASHDAAAFAAAGVPTAMIFIRNANGSHNPREAMTLDDFLLGTTLLAWWLAHEACAVATDPPASETRL